MAVNKYYGDKKVVDIIKDNDFVILVLENGEKEEISNKMLPSVITDEKVDLTTLRDLRVKPMVEDILRVLLDWNVKTSEIEYAMTTTITSLNVNLKEADEYLWGVNTENRTVSQVDKVLKKYAKEGSTKSKVK